MWKLRLAEVKCASKLPIIRKCCFCIPVRKGIIIFGYVNLTVSLLSFPLLIFLLVEQLSNSQEPVDATRKPIEPARLPMTIAWVLIDVVMNVALIIAAHKKNRRLLKIYLYFGLVFQTITLFMDIAFFEHGDYLENIVYFFFIGLNLYLLFLVHSTIKILETSSEVQYVAHQDPLTVPL